MWPRGFRRRTWTGPGPSIPEKLGLEPSEERPGGLLYHCASGTFALFLSGGESDGTFTQMAWDVDDIDATVADLRGRGVVFEEDDIARGGGELSEQGRQGRAGVPGSGTARATCSGSDRR